MIKPRQITVFEHESLRIDRGSQRLSSDQLGSLQQFYGDNGVPYFSLIHNGVKFNEYVGVIQIGDTLIEVLPKAEKTRNSEKWRLVLIGMLNAVGIFDTHAPSNSSLHLKANSILDLYFELFIIEIEYLIRRGLIKKYSTREGNKGALKGKIVFSKHIRENEIHKERFFLQYSSYDKLHLLHGLLLKALKLLQKINLNPKLHSRITTVLMDFPEVSDIMVTDQIFERIVYNRKSEPYRNAIEIAQLILMNYHPDVRRGAKNVLALMFDMNHLWEKFVFESLRKHKLPGHAIEAQSSKSFWKPVVGSKSKMRPDIVINKQNGSCTVLDTKWKYLGTQNPSSNDLRQMYVYSKYYEASRVALIYPGDTTSMSSGTYYDISGQESDQMCSVITLTVVDDIRKWQKQIYEGIAEWMES